MQTLLNLNKLIFISVEFIGVYDQFCSLKPRLSNSIEKICNTSSLTRIEGTRGSPLSYRTWIIQFGPNPNWKQSLHIWCHHHAKLIHSARNRVRRQCDRELSSKPHLKRQLKTDRIKGVFLNCYPTPVTRLLLEYKRHKDKSWGARVKNEKVAWVPSGYLIDTRCHLSLESCCQTWSISICKRIFG